MRDISITLVGMKVASGLGHIGCVSKHVRNHLLAKLKLSSDAGMVLIGLVNTSIAAGVSVDIRSI